MSQAAQVTAFAPASTANLAVGFDMLGHPLARFGDRVTAFRSAEPGVRLIDSGGPDLPVDPARNTAAAGVIALFETLRPGFGVKLQIDKGIPLGSGIGGSAASAVAGVVAANALLSQPLAVRDLLPFAVAGEAEASGARHADNVAPALLGGLLIVRSTEASDIVRLPVPPSLRCVIALPQLRLDTRQARAVLPASYPLAAVVQQGANLAGVVAGLFTGDLAMIGRSMRDVLIEPHRAALIPGFHEVQAAALGAGALACSISGAGPALFAWCDGEPIAESVRAAMVQAFANWNLPAEGWISPVGGAGARVEALT